MTSFFCGNSECGLLNACWRDLFMTQRIGMVFRRSIEHISVILTILFCLCAAPIYTRAQTSTTGSIAGVVSDPSGATIPVAEIVVKDQATEREFHATSDSAGNFRVPLLPPGKYNVNVTASGFKALTIQDVVVQITEVTTVNAHLQIGTKSENITVTGAPPLLQTENATLGRVIDGDTIVNLPLVNRNYTQILGLTAGTNSPIEDATTLGN